MSSKASNRLEFIESLRLIAALLVFFQHLIEQYSQMPALNELMKLGPGLSGVVIFFCVSGYVVPMSVRKGFNPIQFMIRRIFRVYPLMIFAFIFLLAVGVSNILPRWNFMFGAPISLWIVNILIIQEYLGVKPFLGVTWTLAVEFIWYGLFAIAFWRFNDRAGIMLNIVMPVIITFLMVASLILGMRLPLGRFAMIYACILGYQAYLFDLNKITRRTLIFSSVLFLAVTGCSNLVAFGLFHHPQISLIQALWPWTLGPVAFLAVVMVTKLRNSQILNQGVLPRWGAASYSIYLFHPIGLAAAAQYAPNPWAGIALAIGITGILSFIGYRYVELSGVKLGQTILRNFQFGQGAGTQAAR